MSVSVRYNCDVCGKDCSDDTLYGRLIVEVKGPKEGLYMKGEFCGWACAQQWMSGKPMGKDELGWAHDEIAVVVP